MRMYCIRAVKCTMCICVGMHHTKLICAVHRCVLNGLCMSRFCGFLFASVRFASLRLCLCSPIRFNPNVVAFVLPTIQFYSQTTQGKQNKITTLVSASNSSTSKKQHQPRIFRYAGQFIRHVLSIGETLMCIRMDKCSIHTIRTQLKCPSYSHT